MRRQPCTSRGEGEAARAAIMPAQQRLALTGSYGLNKQSGRCGHIATAV